MRAAFFVIFVTVFSCWAEDPDPVNDPAPINTVFSGPVIGTTNGADEKPSFKPLELLRARAGSLMGGDSGPIVVITNGGTPQPGQVLTMINALQATWRDAIKPTTDPIPVYYVRFVQFSTSDRVSLNLGPADAGNLSYDSDAKRLFMWDGTAWQKILTESDLPPPAPLGKFPVLTSIERKALHPAEGDTVYDKTLHRLLTWNGKAWKH